MASWFLNKARQAVAAQVPATATAPAPAPPAQPSSAPAPPAASVPPPPPAPPVDAPNAADSSAPAASADASQPTNILQMLSSTGKLQPLRSNGGGVHRMSSPTGDGAASSWSQQPPSQPEGPPPIRYEPPNQTAPVMAAPIPPQRGLGTGRYSHVHTKSNPLPGQAALPAPPAPMSQSGRSHKSRHSEHLDQALTPYNPNGPPPEPEYGYDTSLAPYTGGHPPPPSHELQRYEYPPEEPEERPSRRRHSHHHGHPQHPPPHHSHRHSQQYGYPPPGPHGYGPPQGYGSPSNYPPYGSHPGYGPDPRMYDHGPPPRHPQHPHDDYYASEVSYSTAPSDSSRIHPTYSPPPGASRPTSHLSQRSKPTPPRDTSLVVLPVDDVPIWPPPHRTHGLLTEHEALQLIAAGTPRFEGKVKNVPCAPKGHYRFFGLTYVGSSKDPGLDDAMPPVESLEMDSFEDMTSALSCLDAWERPAMSGSHGIYPGTVTLSYYVASFGEPTGQLKLKPSEKVKPRKIGMLYVLEQLRYLQQNDLDENSDPADLYRTLYEYLLLPNPQPRYDPYTLEGQVHDLTSALMRDQWIDFSHLPNQTVSRFFYSQEPGVTNSFFHQLLLATELMQRVEVLMQTKGYRPQDKLPEKVLWDYILAKRWKERVVIESPKASSEGSSNVSFKFKFKPYQVETLKNFAFTIKWPNLPTVSDTLDEPDAPNEILEDMSLHCMSWFTGLLLPGFSMPWIAMSALIDCDTETPTEFHSLPQDPSIGFQYRSVSYWHYENIVGRVLGAGVGVSQIGGWIGPCLPSNDLERSQLVRVNQLPPRFTIRMTREDVESMSLNSDPIGAEQSTYPVSDYEQILLDSSSSVDTIRIEKLTFTQSDSQFQDHAALTSNGKQIITHDASLTFAIDARSWRVQLRFNTPFIAAYPCVKGPHVLFCEYKIRVVEVDKLVDIYNWGRPQGFRMRTASSTPAGSGLGSRNRNHSANSSEVGSDVEDEEELLDSIEEVLVVKAFGVLDNAVFARAWCSYWGVSAVVADIGKTCLSCAVREAYAVQVAVCILTDCESVEYEVEEVDRALEGL